LYVIFLHDPQSGEFPFTMLEKAPTKGNEGSEESVENPWVIKPLGPLEHAKLLSEVEPSSKTEPYLATVLMADATEKSAARERIVEVSFMVRM